MYTEVTQLVEYRSPKPAVGSSSLSFRAINRIMNEEGYLIY